MKKCIDCNKPTEKIPDMSGYFERCEDCGIKIRKQLREKGVDDFPNYIKMDNKIKVLNLCCGVGGNRKLWKNAEVTSVDNQQSILDVYKHNFPQDTIINADAYKYLLDHYKEFEFIWISPPCQSHSRFIRSGRNRKPRYPDLRLYEVILFLKHNFKGKWVVENVIPYYGELIPGKKIGRHLFWSNFEIPDFDIEQPKNFINLCNTEGANKLKEWLGLSFSGNVYYRDNHDPSQVLRNCVHPKLGLHVFNSFTN